MGRKKKDNPRNKQYRLRLTQEEVDKMAYISERLEITESVFLRNCINVQFSALRFIDRLSATGM